MPKVEYLPVSTLSLDLQNFRTVPQKKEQHSLHSMIAISPDRFWALVESLLDDGYHATENIVVLKSGSDAIVKEGNRRVGGLKLIWGLIPFTGIDVPPHLEAKIKALSVDWKAANEKVPCSIFAEKDADFVDRLVALTHGKGEKAGREDWNTVARARHNRDKQTGSEPGLDLLEKYLKAGGNVDKDQAQRWAGDYPLTVLDEATKRIAPRVGAANARDLVDQYPKSKYSKLLDKVMLDIGLGNLDFKAIRSGTDFGQAYGIPSLPTTAAANQPSAGTASHTSNSTKAGATSAASAAVAPASRGKPAAAANNDPKSVRRKLKLMAVRGNNREKVVTLQKEITTLKLETHPHAFCFLLRSMFEISAKAYCGDHGLPTQAGSQDKSLADLLREVTKHVIAGNPKSSEARELTGAMTLLAKHDSILSVTSMNQLVHNPNFSLDETHISTMFNNIFPLLAVMNR